MATYWDLEGYPKAWGHGVEDNPVPRDAEPREPLPMRDESQFKEATMVAIFFHKYYLYLYAIFVL